MLLSRVVYRPRTRGQKMAAGVTLAAAAAPAVARGTGAELLLRQCEALKSRATDFFAGAGRVTGAERFMRRVDGELRVAELLAAEDSPAYDHVRGLANNVSGLAAELDAATTCPGVTGLGLRVRCSPGITAEVDVVGHHGGLWLEVKAGAIAGAGLDGLVRQLAALRAAADDPANAVHWRSPVVALMCPMDSADAATLHTALSDSTPSYAPVLILPCGDAWADALPPPPPRLPCAVLDVTALLALISEVSHSASSGHDAPAVATWAASHPAWRACLAAEASSPVLAALTPELDGRALHAPAAVVTKVDELVAMAGGARERARWGDLRGRLTVHPDIAGDANDSANDTANDTAPGRWALRGSESVALGRRLDAAGAPESAVAAMRLASLLGGVYVGANRRAARAALECGLPLPCVLHQTVWLANA